MADRKPVTSALALQPLVHVQDLATSIAFYERLGGSIIHGSPEADWVLIQLGTAQIGLIADPPDTTAGESSVELSFHSPVPLDQLQQELHGTDVQGARLTTDKNFGRQLLITTPDGMLLKISQREPDLYP